MNNCNNKVKHTCGTQNFATCVNYEGTTNSQSELAEESCLDLEITTQDTYEQLEEIKTEIDLSELGEQCLDYVEVEGKIIVKNVLLKYETEICELKEKVEALENRQVCDMLITDCVDLKCLTDACSNEITTYGQLFQALIDNACEV